MRKSLREKLLEALTPEAEAGWQPTRLREALESGDFDVVREILQARFSGFPRDSYRKNSIADYEGYYSNVVHTCMDWTGLSVHAENSTSKGCIDLTVDAGTRVCIFEFKVLREGVTPGGALQQIHDRKYADKYRARGVPIHLIGVEFDPVSSQNGAGCLHFDVELA